MVMLMEYVGLLPIVFGAFFLKAMTGFGASIMLISIGGLFWPMHELIVVCVLLELLSAGKLIRDDWQPGAFRYWGPLCVTMSVGAVVGSLLLKQLDPSRLNVLVGIFVFCLGCWLFFQRRDSTHTNTRPNTPSKMGMFVTGVAGVCGGLLGIAGPPIVWYFGQRLTRQDFRAVVVPIFLSASIACMITHLIVGLLTMKLFVLALCCLPIVFLAFWGGSRVFNLIPEQRFGQLIGTVLCLASLKMLFA